MANEKKKFKDTKVGSFLAKIGSALGDDISDVLPDKGILGMFKNVLQKDDTLPPQDKETALKLLEMDLIEMQEVTKRWVSDNESDSYLARNVRPLILCFLTFAMTVFIVLDSTGSKFTIAEHWVDLLQTLLTSTFLAYFGSRGFEKFTKIKRK